MIIAMALMTGYREDLQSKLVRGNAAVIAYPGGARPGRSRRTASGKPPPSPG